MAEPKSDSCRMVRQRKGMRGLGSPQAMSAGSQEEIAAVERAVDRRAPYPKVRMLAVTGIAMVAILFFSCRPKSVEEPLLLEQNAPSAPNSIAHKTCQPVLILLPEESDRVDVGAWQYVFNVLLVGCSDDLKMISQSQKEHILRLAKSQFKEKGFKIISEFRTQEFRLQFRKAINEILGAERVSDAYLNLLAAGESM